MKGSLRSMTLGLTAALLLGAAGVSRAQAVPATLPPADAATRARIAEGFGKMPLHFVENRGQLDARVAYYVPGKDKTIYFTGQGLTFALNGPAERWALKLDFIGARAGVRPEGQEPAGATYSYFKGPRSEWQAGLETYSQVVYRDLWPGIDLVYEGTVNRMKYTFRVKPGADPDRIRLAWRGASGVALNRAGELAVTTPAGGFTDERPVSWQEKNGRRVDVATKYRLAANGAYGFKLGRHDRSRELVIDPAVLVYAGFLGGSGAELGTSIAVDSAGNAYVAGFTNSDETSFPVSAGPDLTHNGADDAFVAKVNAAGTALVYAGYIGGVGTDQANGIAVDSAGNAYVTGVTGSSEASFPVTVGPDLTFNGGQDAFVAKVNASGTALLYAGYIGGAGGENGYGIAVNGAGNAYIVGDTVSDETSFPVTVGPDLTHNGTDDAFVAKVNASGTALLYAGYIGGASFDDARGIAVDSSGSASVAGTTQSDETSFPVTVGPDLTFNGVSDTFVAKVNASGTALVYAGFIGGAGGDPARAIAVDSAGNAYVTGTTLSDETTFPVAVGPDLTFNGNQDAFVAKVNASGTALLYAGYIGGSQLDNAGSIAVDGAGRAYVTGTTLSDETTFPVAVGPDLTFNGAFGFFGGDAFVASVEPGGAALGICGYIGGSGDDAAGGIALDSAGNAYVTGIAVLSDETTFPVTVGPDLTFNGGSIDAFVAKIGVQQTPQDQIAALIAQIEALITGGTLAQNKANPLITKLESVSDKLDAGQVGAACNQLGAFINQVNAYISNGTLTPAQGQALIDAAEAVQASIFCPGTACNPDPCQNGGICQPNGGSYTCTCPAGWTGTNCEVPQVTCPCNDPGLLFGQTVAGQRPILSCSISSGSIFIQLTNASVSVDANIGQCSQFPGGVSFPTSPEQSQYCIQLLEQAAANQGVTCN